MRRAKKNKLGNQLPRQEPVVTLNRVIDAAQRHTPCEAMGYEEPVRQERVIGTKQLGVSYALRLDHPEMGFVLTELRTSPRRQ